MFRLLVFYGGEIAPKHTEALKSASGVLMRVGDLLGLHTGCQRIEIVMDDCKLFAVDGAGNRLG